MEKLTEIITLWVTGHTYVEYYCDIKNLIDLGIVLPYDMDSTKKQIYNMILTEIKKQMNYIIQY